MKHQSIGLLIALFILASASFAHADIVVHELGSTAANALHDVSRNFIIGCAILAAGIVVATFIAKKK